ncbi:hypothetical protein LCGC14_1996170, partial [marine sediment metagenome]
FMPVWISRGKVFSHMIFSNKESAEEVMKNKIYSKNGKIIEINDSERQPCEVWSRVM